MRERAQASRADHTSSLAKWTGREEQRWFGRAIAIATSKPTGTLTAIWVASAAIGCPLGSAAGAPSSAKSKCRQWNVNVVA